MSRVCTYSGKGPQSGNKRSKSMIATRRKWNVNLQTHTIIVDGKKTRVKMSAHAYRSLNKGN
ncbi:MAG: 50S ribosomal protein L28 [Coprobacillus sp.]|nr:50S ribosomal protein L28 [Coprobacillus sp.]